MVSDALIHLLDMSVNLAKEALKLMIRISRFPLSELSLFVKACSFEDLLKKISY